MKVIIDRFHPICDDMGFSNVYENSGNNSSEGIVIGDKIKFPDDFPDEISIHLPLDGWINIPLECVIRIEE